MQIPQQRRTVAVSSMVVGTMGLLRYAEEDKTLPPATFIVGWGFTFTILSIFHDLGAGDFAAGFAMLIMISAVLWQSDAVLKLLSKRAGRVGKPRKKRGKQGKPEKPSRIEELMDEFDLGW